MRHLILNVLGFLLCVAAGAFVGLILLSDCGPDGYGQRECLNEWGAALADLVAHK